MLLSIIIPMYNAEEYVEACLDSVLNQGLAPDRYEIIVVNDGSNDGSCEIVERYLSEHSNIRLFSQQNRGQSAARNVGIANARGEYIQFVDADDFLLPGSLKQVVSFAAQEGSNAGTDVITFGIEQGYPEQSLGTTGGTGQCTWRGDGYDYIATHNYSNGPWFYLLNREYARRHNLQFEEGKLCEDAMFTLSALLNARKVAHVDVSVYFYVFRPDSTITTVNPKRVEKLLDGYEHTVAYFNKTIAQHGNMTPGCRARVLNRRDSFAFFLLARLLKFGLYARAKKDLKFLKGLGVYPIREFPGADYEGFKFKVLTKLFNFGGGYLAVCELVSLLRKR